MTPCVWQAGLCDHHIQKTPRPRGNRAKGTSNAMCNDPRPRHHHAASRLHLLRAGVPPRTVRGLVTHTLRCSGLMAATKLGASGRSSNRLRRAQRDAGEGVPSTHQVGGRSAINEWCPRGWQNSRRTRLPIHPGEPTRSVSRKVGSSRHASMQESLAAEKATAAFVKSFAPTRPGGEGDGATGLDSLSTCRGSTGAL